MFTKIMELIKDVMPVIEIGQTAYLDEVPWILAPMKGTDPRGRKFISLPVESLVEHEIVKGGKIHRDNAKGVVTLFQRYSDDPYFWTEASSHPANKSEDGSMATLGVLGGFREGNDFYRLFEKSLVELLTDGYTRFKDPTTQTYRQITLRLLKPEEVEKLKAE